MDCVAQGNRGMRHHVTVAGARLAENPIVVPVLVAVNVLVYALTAMQSATGSSNQIFNASALWPILVAGGEWWRLFTSGFLHLGLGHVAMNMIALWVIGRDLELLLGRVRFIAVYLLSLLGGSTAVFLLGTEVQPVGGASGAVYGLMGGIAVAALRLKISLRPVLAVIVLNIAFSVFVPGISLLGHIGGLVLGAVSTAALVYAPRVRREWWQAGALAALLVAMIAILVTRDIQFGNVVCSGTGPQARCGQLPG